MEMRRCGSSVIELSLPGIGCWSFGGGDYRGPQRDGAEREAVAAAIDHGVAFFDTAPAYNDGRSEEALGRALHGRRHQAVIGTKIASADCVSPESIRRACEGSLRRRVRPREGTAVRMLGHDRCLSWRYEEGGLTVELPDYLQAAENRPCETVYCFKLEAVPDRVGNG